MKAKFVRGDLYKTLKIGEDQYSDFNDYAREKLGDSYENFIFFYGRARLDYIEDNPEEFLEEVKAFLGDILGLDEESFLYECLFYPHKILGRFEDKIKKLPIKRQIGYIDKWISQYNFFLKWK